MNETLKKLITEVDRVVLGQENLKRDVLVSLLCEGHILIEGAPGLAKTQLVNAFSKALDLDAGRLQFTPDLLPSDLIGARIYNPDTREFEVKKGPIFTQMLLADEINRAPSKVQSALLECMQEKQVTIGNETFTLTPPFIVLATQNPLEQEGTYNLPEAQLDRFLIKSLITYPDKATEKQILQGLFEREKITLKPQLTSSEIVSLQEQASGIEVSESIYEYICNIVLASRKTDTYSAILYGASPRASIALLKTSMAHALIKGRDYVIPEDVKAMTHAVLRHRIILDYSAIARGVDADDIISDILRDVEI